MTRKMQRTLLTAGIILLAAFCLTGCKPSKKKVESSSYYKELLKKYKKVKKEKEKLEKASQTQEDISDAEKRAEKYLAKIARDRLARMEIGYADDMEESVYILRTCPTMSTMFRGLPSWETLSSVSAAPTPRQAFFTGLRTAP